MLGSCGFFLIFRSVVARERGSDYTLCRQVRLLTSHWVGFDSQTGLIHAESSSSVYSALGSSKSAKLNQTHFNTSSHYWFCLQMDEVACFKRRRPVVRQTKLWKTPNPACKAHFQVGRWNSNPTNIRESGGLARLTRVSNRSSKQVIAKNKIK